MRQDAPLKIRIFDVDNLPPWGRVCKVHCGLREKRHGIARVDENLVVAAPFLFDARFRSRGNAHSKIATAHKRFGNYSDLTVAGDTSSAWGRARRGTIH